MKRAITALFFLAFYFLTIQVQARPRLQVPHLPAPYVYTDKPGFNRCERLEPCPGRLLVVRNPQHDKVTVVVWCLSDPRTETEFEIAARSEATVDIGTNKPGGLTVADCSIARWRN